MLSLPGRGFFLEFLLTKAMYTSCNQVQIIGKPFFVSWFVAVGIVGVAQASSGGFLSASTM